MVLILSEIPAVFRGRFFHDTFKIVIEVSQVIVPAFKAYLRYWLVCFRQHFSRQADTNTLHILHESAIGFFLKVPAE